METPPELTADETDQYPLDPAALAARLDPAVGSIRCAGITKRYGPVVALQDVDFTATVGEVHCIAGPNGSGKTTLGRLVAGLARATAGTVQAPHDEVGLGFQEPRFYPRLSTRENLSVFARLSGVNTDDPWVRAISAILRLDRVSHQPAGELSGGFKQKLDLALTVLDAPAYLWLDEPLGDLDETSRQRVVQLLEAYAAAGGGVVVSTHDLEAFERVATQLSVLLDGHMLATVDVRKRATPLSGVVDRVLDRSSDD